MDRCNNIFLWCSARIWAVHAEWKDSDSIDKVESSVLYGHNARVWDCCITDSVSLTSSWFTVYVVFFPVLMMFWNSGTIIFFKMVSLILFM